MCRPTSVIVQLARVLYPYAAQNEDELNLVEGDTVTVLCDESASYPEGWLVGTVDGKMGVFPGNYIEILETKVSLITTVQLKVVATVMALRRLNIHGVCVLDEYL